MRGFQTQQSKPATAEYYGITHSSQSPGSSISWSNLNFPADDCYIFAFVNTVSSSNIETNSLTIGGVVATRLAITRRMSLWRAHVAGATGAASATLASSVSNSVQLALFAVRGLKSVDPVQLNAYAGTGSSQTISVKRGGIVLAGVASLSGDTSSIVFTGLDVLSSRTTGSQRMGMAMRSFDADVLDHPITMTNVGRVIVVSLR